MLQKIAGNDDQSDLVLNMLRPVRRLAASAVAIIFLCGLVRLQGRGETAEELLNRGSTAYSAGSFKEAEVALAKFLTDYGQSGQVAQLLPRVLPMLAICQIRNSNFEDAGATIDQVLALRESLPSAAILEELRFWRGICHLKKEEFELARETFQKFATSHPRSDKRVEALLLSATSYSLEKNWKESADNLAQLIQTLSQPEKGRAVVLRFHCLLQLGALDEALRLLIEFFPQLDQMIQISAMQVFALELGTAFLAEQRHLDAIACFQRIWSRARVLALQQERLNVLTARKTAAEQRKDTFTIFQTSQLLAKVERELKIFREFPSFDAALRLRLASAYLAMERFREAALVLDAMLHEMPADEIVEGASATLLKCWGEIERWPKVIEAADLFIAKFPQSKNVPEALFLKARAQQELAAYPDAVATYDQLAKTFPDSSLAPRAKFMAGYTQLMAEEYHDASERMEAVYDKHQKHEIAEAAVFWKGMGLSMAKAHQESRAQMERYLNLYKNGAYRTQAQFRKAYSAHSMKDYQTSICELRLFLRDNPDSAEADEALILLGDALMATGEMQQGIAAYKRISQTNPRFFEEGWFKVGRALKQLEDLEGMKKHFEEFIQLRPKSTRLPEAFYQIGWVLRQQQREDEAKKLYWSAVKEMGDDAGRHAVEDLLLGLLRLHRGEKEKHSLREGLRALRDKAEAEGKKVFQSRLAWALSKTYSKDDEIMAQTLLDEAGRLADPATASPQLLADVAEASYKADLKERAALLYRNLIKWNPRAPQKDRALFCLGFIAKEQGRSEEALKLFARFQREVPDSLLASRVLLAKSAIELDLGQADEALKTLETLLATQGAAGRDKAAALFAIGEIFQSKGDLKKAYAYYQRIYVLYSKFGDLVAKAYLRCGTLLETLKDLEGARKTYEEMLGREDLPDGEELRTARERLAQLAS